MRILELGQQDEEQGGSEQWGLEQSPPALNASEGFLHAGQTGQGGGGRQSEEPLPPSAAAVAHTHAPSSSTPREVL